MTPRVLVFGYGNPSRGDDALGPEFVRRLEARCADAIARGELEVMTDFQLQPEHALDLRGRRAVYFVDASATGADVEFLPVTPARDATFTTHALSPRAVLGTYESIEQAPPPASWVISIPGAGFELGEPMSERARTGLDAALERFCQHLGW